MNLKELKKSRKKIVEGDIFALLLPNNTYLFGRVISTIASIGPMENCNLIYIYRDVSDDIKNVPELTPENLLVAPIMTNNLPWRKGYFEVVQSKALNISDKLKQHCFHCSFNGKFYDEYSNQLEKAVEPVGIWALHSYRTIDDEISTALGIPLSED